MAATPTVAETVQPKDSSSAKGTSRDRVLVDPLLADDEVHPNASSSSDPRPPGLEPQLGAGPDAMPRERPAMETQPIQSSRAAERHFGSHEEIGKSFEELF